MGRYDVLYVLWKHRKDGNKGYFSRREIQRDLEVSPRNIQIHLSKLTREKVIEARICSGGKKRMMCPWVRKYRIKEECMKTLEDAFSSSSNGL